VAYCPVCKAEWMPPIEDCPICGRGLDETSEPGEWTLIGAVADKLSADFARETLSTYDIPAVVMSKSGFFGNIGLTLTSFYNGKQGLFEISVPAECSEEASELLAMTLGEKWQRKEQ
jgi:hypothetical protein